ncbi:RING-H2 finger protein ATL80-like [Neltuma alba]|uniref:RING-H2 finger protein ATL80-like n=1 Tax=Neltuma alba TaxID=207710 RepID=UPI0010A3B1E4|nr:RING-H2 finger protein ATL80-like [Prosopis alba]XP_028789373.1 RING-H2 finger protein ATL80-like [Prosopis alba]
MNSNSNTNNVEGQGQLGYFVNPLIISGAGIICSCVALATYHFILFRLCLQGRRQLQQIPQPISPPPEDIPCGVDPEILKKIPILPYSHKKDDAFRLDQTECVICLGELQDGEKVRLLPSCSHAFHIPCIDLWFAQNSNCPICRAPLIIAPPPSLPVASETVVDAEPRVCHIQSDHNIAASGSTSRAPPGAATLQHSLSVAYRHEQEKPQDLMVGMKRSLSMDHSSYVSVSIQRDEANKAAASSSSSPSVAAGIGIAHAKALDHVSSMLMMSFAQFRNSRNDRSKGILPN